MKNRFRVYTVNPRELVPWFNRYQDSLYVQVPIMKGLPEDAQILQVFNDPMSLKLGLIVAHESFDEVPDGSQGEHFGLVELEWKTVTVTDLIPSKLELNNGDSVVIYYDRVSLEDRDNVIKMGEALIERFDDLNILAMPKGNTVKSFDDPVQALLPTISTLTEEQQGKLIAKWLMENPKMHIDLNGMFQVEKLSHCLQYATVGHENVVVTGTSDMTDEAIRIAAECAGTIERFDRCPVCEEWTKTEGVLRPESKCPAVVSAINEHRHPLEN